MYYEDTEMESLKQKKEFNYLHIFVVITLFKYLTNFLQFQMVRAIH